MAVAVGGTGGGTFKERGSSDVPEFRSPRPDLGRIAALTQQQLSPIVARKK